MFKILQKKKSRLPASLINIKKALMDNEKKTKRKLSPEEQDLVENIKVQTSRLNINNVTRTKAYLDFYNKYPEIHWAFLGHMVSRNGGWNMTDLKGGLLPRLLTKKERKSFFSFLERGNWLIFQDAYPQFLVYEESRKRGQNLFYLLPHLNVSTFMETIWCQFWKEPDTYILTVALIINEQSYLESRVLKNSVFKKEVFQTLEYKIQDILAMNHILFPYEENGKIYLVGETLHQFERLHERILLGKRLYSILFSDSDRQIMVKKWANSHPHTGSRMDYWPHFFHDVKEGVPERIWKQKIKSCQLAPGVPRIYSPQLRFAWKDMKQLPAEISDWYEDWQVIYYLINTKEKVNGEIKNDYCKTLERLELAAIAKKAISILD